VTETPNVPTKPRADLVKSTLPFPPAGSEIREAFIGQAAPNFFYFHLHVPHPRFIERRHYSCRNGYVDNGHR
jgi:hypothetical protein